MELVGYVMNYDWGKVGTCSEVAKLASLNSPDMAIGCNTPYAELWMGDHPSGPSSIKSTGEALSQILKYQLPFLFKVLSIRKALSIQVHPNKEEAERLHRDRPDVYKDDNHKPELAIALSPFTAMCGFRAPEEIVNFCGRIPPLAFLFGECNVNRLKNNGDAALKGMFEAYTRCLPRQIAHCICAIKQNFADVLSEFNLLDIFSSLQRDYPDDPGVLLIFVLNIIRLQPGQAIFLKANEIHAYISGDCVECMACSDNVIRAGLTPKYKDVNLLIACLNYQSRTIAEVLFKPCEVDDVVKMFIPPVDDFAVLQICLPPERTEYHMKIQPQSYILLIVRGECSLRLSGRCAQIEDNSDLALKRGSIVHIPPEAAPTFKFVNNGRGCETLLAYMATCNTFNK